ncbi:MAG: fibrobacter succinogenes major paralogous domain-containing protein [Fibrobacter sp.]|jgi:uncharacterized protein (TIGR02145 family)|nr:fibrobacter succinogenes major paralogous domain-containing protein [Fibrobacter sp.]
MNSFSPKMTILLSAATLAFFLSACGGDSGTGGNNEIELSSSSVAESKNPLSSSSLNAVSSSSVKQESSSSAGASSSSSEIQNNSSSSSLCADIYSFLPVTSFCDARDGRYYQTATIGAQVWMAENLNYVTESGSWCYDNSESNCAQYGRLYDWDTAMEVCPEGWHLPNNDEWVTLVNFTGGDVGTALKSATGWNGTDNYGFNALPGGKRNYYDGSFYDFGNYGNWWTATDDSDFASYQSMNTVSASVNGGIVLKSYGFSVRCVQDMLPPIYL